MAKPKKRKPTATNPNYPVRPWTTDQTSHYTYIDITDKAAKQNPDSTQPQNNSPTDNGYSAALTLEGAFLQIYNLIATNIVGDYGSLTAAPAQYTTGPQISSIINTIRAFANKQLLDQQVLNMSSPSSYYTDLQKILVQLTSAATAAQVFADYVRKVQQHVDALCTLYNDKVNKPHP